MSKTLLAIAGGVVFGVAGLFAADQYLAAKQPSRTIATFERFPNVLLQTHEGKKVRFYDDLLKGKTVAINFFYVACKSF